MGKQLRVDFPEKNAILFFEGTESELQAAMSSSKLEASGKFTRTGLEYYSLVSINSNKNLIVISKEELQKELEALGL